MVKGDDSERRAGDGNHSEWGKVANAGGVEMPHERKIVAGDGVRVVILRPHPTAVQKMGR